MPLWRLLRTLVVTLVFASPLPLQLGCGNGEPEIYHAEGEEEPEDVATTGEEDADSNDASGTP